jgi:hypothetical protein
MINNNNNNIASADNNNNNKSSTKIRNKNMEMETTISKDCCKKTFTTMISLQLHLITPNKEIQHTSYCILCLNLVKRLREHYPVSN